jgi:hypothetical protein
MGIAAQAVEYLPGSAEGWLGVDHPVGLPGAGQVAGKCGRFGQGCQVVKELQRACLESMLQLRQE